MNKRWQSNGQVSEIMTRMLQVGLQKHIRQAALPSVRRSVCGPWAPSGLGVSPALFSIPVKRPRVKNPYIALVLLPYPLCFLLGGLVPETLGRENQESVV